MKLKQKAILIIVTTFIALTVLLFLASGFILVSSYVRLEEQDTKKNVERIVDAVNNDILTLSSSNKDYSSWDETYSFMKDRNEDYIESEMVNSTFASLRVNFIAMVDENKNIVFSKGFDTSASKETPVNEKAKQFLDSFKNSYAISALQKNKGLNGIAKFGDEPMLVSARVILPSDETGSPRGYMLMARALNSEEINSIRKLTKVDFDLLSFNSETTKYYDRNNSIKVNRLNRYTVEGYSVIEDIYGDPAVVVKASLERLIFNQGLAAVKYIMLSLVAIGIIFSFVALKAVDKLMLSRLFKLNNEINQITYTKDFSLRVEVKGKDEISDLALSMNHMLARLDNSLKDLKESNEKLKELDELKNEFISLVSHELRTPLTSMMGFAKLSKKKFIKIILPLINMEDEKVKKACVQMGDNVDIIISEGERLTEIVNNVLDISKMEAGEMEYKREPLNMKTVLEKAMAAAEPLVIQKKLELVKDIEEDMPLILGDEDKLHQVVINLISNAVKFTAAGSVTCKAKLIDNEIVVSIVDTGMGIAKENYDKVFERFKQLGDSLVNKSKGTGLGLPICKSIIEAQGGRIWVEGVLGQGSCFSFSLPVTR